MATRRSRSDYENACGGDDDYDEDDVPLHRKQAFGAGLKRKKVEFVKATTADDTAAASSVQRDRASAVSDLYASIVMGSANSSDSQSNTPTPVEATPVEDKEPPICAVCSLPVTGPIALHNASLAHQVSLEHSHPPSALDRSRMGLKALTSQGWDPDARLGLGREGAGMRFPIKVANKEDTLGIGAVLPDKVERTEKKAKPLSAKEAKAKADREKRRAEKLQRDIYGSVDVEKYLRGDGGDGG